MAVDSPFMRVPPEIRMAIYEHLLNTGGGPSIAIRNKPGPTLASNRKANGTTNGNNSDEKKRLRKSYHVLEKTLMRRSYETTYHHEGNNELHPAIMAVNQKIREEAAHYLYGQHSFHFGTDLEAVAPFLNDRTPSTRSLIQNITIHRRASVYGSETELYDWAACCRVLQTLPRLKKLTVVVGGGRPRRAWDGPRELSVSDLRLLYATRHESMEWAHELAGVKAVAEVEVRADMQFMPAPTTTPALIFAAFSAVIETALVEFLRDDLGLPAGVAGREEDADWDASHGSRGGCLVS